MANPANFLLRALRPVSAILGIASGLVLNSSRAATWSEIDSALPSAGVNVRAVVIASKTPATIYATATGAEGSSYIFKTTDGAATWRPISSTVLANSVLVDPQNSSVVYALTGRGILKSTNGGDTWARAAAGLPDIFVSMLAIDPVTTSNLYAVVGNAIFKSTNGGESWNGLNTGFPPNTFSISVFVDPATPSNVYATGFAPQNGGPAAFLIAGTTDGGVSWNTVTANLPPNASLRLLAIAPTSPATLYAIGSLSVPGGPPPGQGLLKSTDRGQSWTAVDVGLPAGASIVSVVLDPNDASAIYLGVVFPFAEAGGILKSTDGGKSWRAISTGLPANTPIQSLAIDPVNSSTLYFISNGTFFKSTDGGAHWNKAVTGLSAVSVGALAVNRFDAGAVYAAVGNSLFKSVDSGSNWDKLFSFQLSIAPGAPFAPPFLSDAPAYPRSLLIDSSNPDILYAGTVRGNGCYFADNLLFKSIDGGRTWTDGVSPDRSGCVLGGLFGPSAGLKAIDPSDPNTLYVAETDDEDGGYGLLQSRDGGATWNPFGGNFPGNVQAGVWALAVDPGNPSTLYAGVDDVPIYSDDGTSQPGAGGVFKSTDGGATWKPIGLTGAAVNLLVIDPAQPGALYAATEGNYGSPRGFRGLFKSTDGGASWSEIGNGLGELRDLGANMTAIVIDPVDSNILYAGVSGGGVFKTSDGGATWSRLNQGLTNLDVRSLAIAPGGGHTLYAGTSNGLFRIVDVP
jgi:photosystem II stability/assembly factor-like uncharacterized protein